MCSLPLNASREWCSGDGPVELTVDLVAGRVRAGPSCPESAGSAECPGESRDLPTGMLDDQHVAAILRNLDVRTRGEAAAEAGRLDWPGQDRERRLPT